MSANMTYDTSLALMKATQQDSTLAADKIKSTRNEKNIDAAAQDFEAVFVAEMMKPMFEGIEVDDTFGGGKGEEIFRGIMLQEIGKIAAQTGKIGVSSEIKTEMLRIQEKLQQQIQDTAQNAQRDIIDINFTEER